MWLLLEEMFLDRTVDRAERPVTQDQLKYPPQLSQLVQVNLPRTKDVLIGRIDRFFLLNLEK